MTKEVIGEYHEEWDMVSVTLRPDGKGGTMGLDILSKYLIQGFEPFSVQTWPEAVPLTAGLMTTKQQPAFIMIKEFHLKKRLVIPNSATDKPRLS